MVRAVAVVSALVGAHAEVAESTGNHWVVLVAGSKGYTNYRHQADVCHAYHLLRDQGIHANNIITMMYDDVAGSSQNPFRGSLYNHPGNNAKDVYKGCKIDYRGSAVTPSTFKKVMTGSGSGKVLKSTSNDHVFVNFVDHGGSGKIDFPNDSLHTNDLYNILNTMHKQNMYKKLTFYMEACYSGSMWTKSVPGVYAVTAANAKESSYAAYCGSQAVVKGKNVGSCLGDLFSINWMEDDDAKDVAKETLKQQYDLVKKKTASGSHVMQYGDKSYTSYKVSAFHGNTFKLAESNEQSDDPAESAVSVREVELKQATYNYFTATTSQERLSAGVDLQAVLKDQLAAEAAFESFLELLYPGDEVKKAAIRETEPMPVNRDCEVSTHQSFFAHGAFDAKSGFAAPFHNYVVNACGDLASTNVDLAEVAKQACIGSTAV